MKFYGSPLKCIEHKPTPQSVLFCDKFINLSTIALYTGISTSHLSMLFSGKRQPSLRVAKLIALALDMSLQIFVTQLEKHAGTERAYLKRSNKRKYQKKSVQAEIPLDKVPAT
jgi:transcriptional regulator with XRE-family HTH domain